jgi:hypothetical protein
VNESRRPLWTSRRPTPASTARLKIMTRAVFIHYAGECTAQLNTQLSLCVVVLTLYSQCRSALKHRLSQMLPRNWPFAGENLTFSPQVDGLNAVWQGFNGPWWNESKLSDRLHSIMEMPDILPDLTAIDSTVAFCTITESRIFRATCASMAEIDLCSPSTTQR